MRAELRPTAIALLIAVTSCATSRAPEREPAIEPIWTRTSAEVAGVEVEVRPLEAGASADAGGRTESTAAAQAGAPGAPTDPPPQVDPAVESPSATDAVNAQSETDEPRTAADETGDRPMSAQELAWWRDPDFHAWFLGTYKPVSEIEPTLDQLEREVLEDVMQMKAADKEGKALALLEKNRATGSAWTDFMLGNFLFERDDLPGAMEAYRAAVDKFPPFRRAWQGMGLVAFREGDFAAAAQSLTRVIQLNGHESQNYGFLGQAYSNLGKFIDAETAFRMAALLDPAKSDWKMGLARALFEQQRFADAASLLASMIQDQPDKADLWMLQASAFVGLSKPLSAAENYEFVDSLGQSTLESLTNLGDIYANEELYGPAVDSYLLAIQLDLEGKSDRVLRAAKMMTGRGAADEAKRLLAGVQESRASELSDEEQKEILLLGARIAVLEGAGEEQARLLEQVLELDPLDGGALIALGQYHGREGNDEQAEFFFERAADVEGFGADARVRHAQLLAKQRKYDEAVKLLQRAQELEPRENVQKYLEDVARAAKVK